MRILAAVPVKDLVNAKQRLVPVLDPAERRALARAMLQDVLTALGAVLAGRVCVVTTDPLVMDVARPFDVECLVERANRGHTEAVAFAQEIAVSRGADCFLTIPGDVPCASPSEIEVLCGAVGGAGVAFAPSASGFGTNAAILSPPAIMPLKFGEPSFDNHLLAARQRGLSPAVLDLPGIGLDIDTPEDLGALLARGSATRSAALLSAWGFPARLSAPR